MNAVQPIKAVGPVVEPGRAAAPPAVEVVSDTASVRVDGRDYRLFFLCGHPRSGTNWTASLLNLHPAVNCQGEFRFEALRQGFDRLERRKWHVASDPAVRAVAERCFRDSVRRVMGAVAPRKPGAEWIGDRTPRSLSPYLPDAPHILVQRDGRDALVSLAIKEIVEDGFMFRREPFRTELGGHRYAILQDPEWFRKNPHMLFSSEGWTRHLARAWRAHVSHDLEVLRRVRDGALDLRIHAVSFERLHADTEGERARMYRFLGLDPTRAAPLSAQTRTTAGFGREDTSSFWRKGAVGDWKHYATDDFRRWFKEEAGATLIELGYEKDENW